jgi:hypothetical protein
MDIQKNYLATKIIYQKIIIIFILSLFFLGCSRGALQGTEKDLGLGFILYYVSEEGTRIEYEGENRENYTVVSNTVDGFYYTKDYILAIRNPSDNTKINSTSHERYSKSCEFIYINKNNHKQKKFANMKVYLNMLKNMNVGIFDFVFTFNSDDQRSCRNKKL